MPATEQRQFILGLIRYARSSCHPTRFSGDDERSSAAGAERRAPLSSQWNGYEKRDFTFREVNRPTWCCRASPHPGKPWYWQARFPDYQTRPALGLLEQRIPRGLPRSAEHLRQSESGGGMGRVLRSRGEEFRPVAQGSLEGISRGGLFVYNWAAKNVEKVNAVYCESPVCDMKSWPGGRGKGLGARRTGRRRWPPTNSAKQQMLAFAGNPIGEVAPVGGRQDSDSARGQRSRSTGTARRKHRRLRRALPARGRPYRGLPQYRHAGRSERPSFPARRSRPHRELRPRAYAGNGARGDDRHDTARPRVFSIARRTGQRMAAFSGRRQRARRLHGRLDHADGGLARPGVQATHGALSADQIRFRQRRHRSTGSTPGAFRLLRDVFARGPGGPAVRRGGGQ